VASIRGGFGQEVPGSSEEPFDGGFGGVALAGIQYVVPSGGSDNAVAWCRSTVRQRGATASCPDLGPDPVSSQV